MADCAKFGAHVVFSGRRRAQLSDARGTLPGHPERKASHMAAKDSKHGSLRAQAARKVRAARGWANLSQPELAAQLGEDVMSLASLRRIEQGKRDVTAAELLHIG